MCIYGSFVAAEDDFVHAADAAQFTAILFSPGAMLAFQVLTNGEHGIDAVAEPGRNQRVDHAVAIQGNNVNAGR